LSQRYPDALCAGAVDAPLLACMHRATDKRNPYHVDSLACYGGDRLIWLYDIELLARSLTSEQWKSLVRAATEKDSARRRTTRDALQRAEHYFHVRCPKEVRNALSKTGEPMATYLDAGAIRQPWIDFLAIGGTAERLRFGRELFFPPAALHALQLSGSVAAVALRASCDRRCAESPST
jgi:hypothetical protein